MDMAAQSLPVQPNRTVILHLELPEEIYRLYQSQAAKLNQPVEQALSDRLRTCWSHDDGRALYFNDERRRELEKMLGRNFATAGHVIDYLRKHCGVKIGLQPVFLKPDLLTRLQYRIGRKRKVEDALGEIVPQALEQLVSG